MAGVVRGLRPAAALGDATAMYMLAHALLHGVGVGGAAEEGEGGGGGSGAGGGRPREAARLLKRVLGHPPEVLRDVGLAQADVLDALGEALLKCGKSSQRSAAEAFEHAARIRARSPHVAAGEGR